MSEGGEVIGNNMSDRELQDWVRAWAARYPVQYDDVLTPLAGLPELSREQLKIVLDWKLEARWQPGTAKSMALESDERIADLTRRAFSCDDDLSALLILDDLKGVGPAVASAILMAQNPSRYTVLDVWAVKSLYWLGELPSGSEPGSGMWLDYLAACRRLVSRTGESLRTVDRALYKGRALPIPSP